MFPKERERFKYLLALVWEKLSTGVKDVIFNFLETFNLEEQNFNRPAQLNQKIRFETNLK